MNKILTAIMPTIKEVSIMKKLILSATLIAATFSAIAGDGVFDNFYKSTPELILKVGGSFNDGNGDGLGNGDTAMISFSLQEKKCYRYRHCFNPVLMWLISDGKESDVNIGGGVDWKYKVPKMQNDGFHIEVGTMVFAEGFNGVRGNRMTFHAGVGMEVSSVIVSVDVYDNPFTIDDHAPLYMVAAGYRF